ncbi:hypothetical protein ABIE44_003105 [Marmoricola sp. OAE513]|uniref:hypothetical protein n=1 Tax=Marmoricola sp. OAE513 TaxID=2817894 RepID=UPI001AE96F47
MNALRSWTRPRSLRLQVLRLLAVRVVGFGALVATVLIGQMVAVRPSAAPFETTPSALPSWTAADQAGNPDCVPAAAWPAGSPATAVVAHSFSDDLTRRIDFDDAWAANHNATDTDDVWVLGICS